jgi:hypothetical protein
MGREREIQVGIEGERARHREHGKEEGIEGERDGRLNKGIESRIERGWREGSRKEYSMGWGMSRGEYREEVKKEWERTDILPSMKMNW